jgi:HAE1 family hydrophobic/amphiphilic exporter-1
MLVDNSIVVLENIFAYRQTDAKPTVSAILGSQEMVSSITSSTLTSVCIFLPMVMFQKQLGMMGQMFNNLAFTIIFSLICSLFVAVALVPVLCSTYLPLDKMSEKDHKGLSYGINRAFDRFFINLGNVYGRGVKWVLHHRKTFIFSIFGLLLVSFISIKWIGFVFMPEESENTISLDVTLPKGSTLDATSEVVAELQQKCWGVLKGVKYTSTTVGGSSFLSSSATTNEATVRFTFYTGKERKPGWDNDKSAKKKVEEFFNDFPGTQIKYSQNMNSVGSGGTVIEIRCDDLNLLRQTATDVQKALETYGSDFITSVTSDLEDGLPQAEIVVDRDRMYELGLNVYSVGSDSSAAINGTTASRYTKNGNDIDVGLQSDSALQEQNVSYVDYESYINGLSKKPQNIILALREKGGKIGKKKTGWDAVDYIAHFVKIGWNVVAVAALDASGLMNYGLTNPVWQSIQSINNGSYVPSNKVADDVRKLFGWV